MDQDQENIINILIDLCDLSYDDLKIKLREYHYCLDCKKHFIRCICNNVVNKILSNDNNISEDDDYYSSSAHTDEY